MGETETKINQCGNKQAGSHKTIYITSICQKSIRKFTHRIRKEQHRTDYSEFRFRKDSLVYNWFLYYIQAQPADIIHTVSESCRKKGRPLQIFQPTLAG